MNFNANQFVMFFTCIFSMPIYKGYLFHRKNLRESFLCFCVCIICENHVVLSTRMNCKSEYLNEFTEATALKFNKKRNHNILLVHQYFHKVLINFPSH